MELARQMMHDISYYESKDEIRSNLTRCIDELKTETRQTKNTLQEEMSMGLTRATALAIAQSVAIAILLLAATGLGINPLLQAAENIRHNQKLPVTGANEFRYLAAAYNNMYTAYKKSIDNLSFKASHDELTGVYNRSGYDLLKDSVDLSTTAFLLFDTDKFKQINDDHGHEAGDQVLQKVANVLLSNFRVGDYVCRIGGDEFVVLMVHAGKDIRRLIENKVMQVNKELSDTTDGLPPVSVSVGVAICEDADSPQALFHNSDIALYYVKEVEKINKEYGIDVTECTCSIPTERTEYKGRTSRVLDFSRESDIAEAALLGKYTNCCQRLGSAGETAMMHGFLNPDAGFFVIEDKNGMVKAQAEIWASKDGALVFDNIEFANTDSAGYNERVRQLRGDLAKFAERSGYDTIVMGCGYNEFEHYRMEKAPVPELTLTPYELYLVQEDNDAGVSFSSVSEAAEYMDSASYYPEDFVYTDTICDEGCVYIKKAMVIS